MKFQLLYADPPWHYANWTAKKNGAAASHYRGAKLGEMQSWPVSELAEKDALLFMWATFPKLDEALAVMDAWGFKYVGAPFVWAKRLADGSRPVHGPGFWTAAGSELVLLGRRGKGLPRRRGTRGFIKQVVHAPIHRPHSRKPEVFCELIEKLVDPCTKLELFARSWAQPLGKGKVCETYIRPSYLEPDSDRGWHGTGLEHDGLTILEAIDYFRELP